MSTDAGTWNGQAAATEDLEQRLQRLEDVVAAVYDTRAMEERIQSKVLEKIRREPLTYTAPARAEPEPPRAPLLLAGPAAARPSAQVYDSPPEPPPPPPPLPAALAGRLSGDDLSLLLDMWTDLRTLWVMVRDPLYRVSWAGKVVPLTTLVYIVVWCFMGSWVTAILGLIGAVILQVTLTYLSFKLLGREFRRFREFRSGRRS
jgi:hypothetical protein